MAVTAAPRVPPQTGQSVTALPLGDPSTSRASFLPGAGGGECHTGTRGRLSPAGVRAPVGEEGGANHGVETREEAEEEQCV